MHAGPEHRQGGGRCRPDAAGGKLDEDARPCRWRGSIAVARAVVVKLPDRVRARGRADQCDGVRSVDRGR